MTIVATAISHNVRVVQNTAKNLSTFVGRYFSIVTPSNVRDDARPEARSAFQRRGRRIVRGHYSSGLASVAKGNNCECSTDGAILVVKHSMAQRCAAGINGPNLIELFSTSLFFVGTQNNHGH